VQIDRGRAGVKETSLQYVGERRDVQVGRGERSKKRTREEVESETRICLKLLSGQLMRFFKSGFFVKLLFITISMPRNIFNSCRIYLWSYSYP
jgi:hypothetical protein